jgi:hypothetical protein
VKRPGVSGTIVQLDASPTVMGEYWHTVRTDRGERREPGSNLELIPPPAANPYRKEPLTAVTDRELLRPEQAIPLLDTQLKEAVEALRHDDSEVDVWEAVTLKVVERTFGEHSREAKQFVATLSYAGQSDEKAQAWHIENIRSKKILLRAFIKTLELIPAHPTHDEDHRFARMAVSEAH